MFQLRPQEYRRYAGAKVRILNEQFIELFDIDLISIRPFDQDDIEDPSSGSPNVYR